MPRRSCAEEGHLDFVICRKANSWDCAAKCKIDIPNRGPTAGGPSLLSWSRDILHCADWLRCESALVRSFECRNPQDQRLSSDYSLENGIGGRRGRRGFAHRGRNRASRLDNQAWHLPRPYRALPPAICKREFLPPVRCRALPVACKPR